MPPTARQIVAELREVPHTVVIRDADDREWKRFSFPNERLAQKYDDSLVLSNGWSTTITASASDTHPRRDATWGVR